MCDIFISAVTHNLPGGAAGPRTHISQSGHGHHHHHCLGTRTMQLDWKLEWAGLFLCPFVWIWSQVFGSDWILCRFDIGTGPPPASTSSSTPSAESLIRGFCLEWGNHINFTISFSWQVRAYHHNNIKLHAYNAIIQLLSKREYIDIDLRQGLGSVAKWILYSTNIFAWHSLLLMGRNKAFSWIINIAFSKLCFILLTEMHQFE